MKDHKQTNIFTLCTTCTDCGKGHIKFKFTEEDEPVLDEEDNNIVDEGNNLVFHPVKRI
jgi:hypothetical protein